MIPLPVCAILFDLDGTLLDSAPDLAAAANAMRQRRGLPPLPLAALRPFVGTGARGMLRIALDIQPTDAQFDALREEFFQSYEACMGLHSQLFEGITDLIMALQARQLPWGIVTNKLRRFAIPITQADAVLAQASVLVCADTTAHAKPHPAPLHEAARQLSVPATQCLYVGDDERDIHAARAAGMHAIAAAYGYLGDSTPAIWQPDAIITRPLQLLELPQLAQTA